MLHTENRVAKSKRSWPRIKEVTHKNGSKAWMVDARINGKGERFFFKSKAEAETKGQQLRIKRKNEGIQGVDIPDRLRVEALEWNEKLTEVGASITEAARFFLAHARPVGGKRNCAEVLEELIEAKGKAGRRDSYLKALRWSLGVFNRSFGIRHINEVTEQDVSEWLDSKHFSLANRKAYLRDVNILFNFAVKKRYCGTNPVALIEKPILEEKEIEVFTVEQVAALLNAAEMGLEPDILPSLAIALFASLRPKQELTQLDWADINLCSRILTVRGRTAKDRRMRHITISENLHDWLLPYKKSTGLVMPFAFRGHLERMKKLRESAGIKHWPRDVMRHCFASYHLAYHKDVSLTQDQLGHGSKSTVLWTNYRALVQPSDAARYWQIMPGAEAEKVAAFAVS